MSRLAIAAEALGEIRSRLLGEPVETCAVLFGRAIMRQGRLARLVIREVQWIEECDYLERSEIKAALRAEVVATVAQRARRSGESVVFVHSHPLEIHGFSALDDSGERALSEFFEARTPGIFHAAMLVTQKVVLARKLGAGEPLAVVGVGPSVYWGREASAGDVEEDTFDRQERLFGTFAQNRLRDLRIGMVGLGGTGSVVLEQLIHLGVRDYLLIDPDTIDSTNLNRLVGARKQDVGRPKVEVAADNVRRIDPDAAVETSRGSVLLARDAEMLADVDFVFCCTDSHGSRAVLNQLAYQFLVPMIDMGVVIIVGSGKVSHIAGRTQMLAPGLSCLQCGNLLSPEAVRVDLLTDFERKADPYVIGVRDPAPAVISLNATMASMAVTMFLSAVAGVPSGARHLNYNGLTGACRPATVERHPSCIVCSTRGALARATEWDLPARQS